MHDFDIVGYAADGEARCADCASYLWVKSVEADPIFAGSEDASSITCDECGETLVEGDAMGEPEKTRTITIRWKVEDYIEGDAEVTEEEYQRLLKASPDDVEQWSMDAETGPSSEVCSGDMEVSSIWGEDNEELWVATEPAPAKTRILVTLEGGIIQGIAASGDTANIEVITLDYDANEFDDDETAELVPQKVWTDDKGKEQTETAPAWVGEWTFDKIDPLIARFLDEREEKA